MDELKEKKEKYSKSLKGKFRLFFSSFMKKTTGSVIRSEFLGNPVIFWLMALIFMANLTNWILLFIFIKPTVGHIILHYNVYFGVDLAGNARAVYIMPIIGLALFLVNVSLARYFYEIREKIAAYILVLATLIVQMSLLIASASVIMINY